MKLAVAAAVLLVAAVTGACATPPPPGLARVDVDLGRQTNKFHVAPGGRWVVVETAGPGPLLLVWDNTLRKAGPPSSIIDDVGVSRDGTRLLRMSSQGPQALSLPDLRLLDRCSTPSDWLPPSYWGVPFLRVGDGWAAVAWEGVLRIDDGPLRAGPVGRPATRHPVASAIDDATGLLVLLGGGNRIEGFDLGAMETVFSAELPTTEKTYDVAAAGGTAWIACRDGDGSFLEFDLRSATVRRRHELGLPGNVSLSLSVDGTTLVAMSKGFLSEHQHPAVLKVFRLGPAGPVETASLSVVLPGVVHDIAIVPEWKTVLLAGKETFAWRYGFAGPVPSAER